MSSYSCICLCYLTKKLSHRFRKKKHARKIAALCIDPDAASIVATRQSRAGKGCCGLNFIPAYLNGEPLCMRQTAT